MTDSTKEKAENEKVFKKLVKKWRTTQEVKGKANLLISKNPKLKDNGAIRNKTDS